MKHVLQILRNHGMIVVLIGSVSYVMNEWTTGYEWIRIQNSKDWCLEFLGY